MESRSCSSVNIRGRYIISPNDLILPKTSSFQPPCTSLNPNPSSSSGSPCSPLLSFPSIEFELTSLDSQSYTSLKDILPATSLINSPTPAGTTSATPLYEIPIRNRLVKQAAWAYLQPMAASPSSSSRPCCFVNPINAFFRLFDCGLVSVLTRTFHQFLVHLRIRSTSSTHW